MILYPKRRRKKGWKDFEVEKVLKVIQKTPVTVMLLIVIGSILYSSNLGNPFLWDDEHFILKNTFIHSLSLENIRNTFVNHATAAVGEKSDYYRPVSFLTYALNYTLDGKNAFGFHLVNDLIHIANAVLLMIFLGRYFKKSLAFLVALIFLIHPLQVQTVAYISGRDSPLSTCFLLISLMFFVKNRSILSISLFILALFTRETTIGFPILILTISFFEQKSFSDWKRVLLKSVPFIGLALAYIGLRLSILNFGNTLNLSGSEEYASNIFIRLVTFFGVFKEYIELMIVPHDLHFRYHPPVYYSIFDFTPIIGLLALLLLIVILLTLYTRGKKSNFWVLFFGAGWFFSCITLSAGVVIPLHFSMQEHWVYMAMVGFFVILGYFGQQLIGKYNLNKIAGVFFTVYVIFLIVYNLNRNFIWGKHIEHDEEILRYEQGTAILVSGLGDDYLVLEDKKKAVSYYVKAIQMGSKLPHTYYNFANILKSEGEFEKAEQMYKIAIEKDAKFFDSYKSLAGMYGERGEWDKSIKAFLEYQKINPADISVYYNLAFAHLMMGDFKQAELYLNELENKDNEGREWKTKSAQLRSKINSR